MADIRLQDISAADDPKTRAQKIVSNITVLRDALNTIIAGVATIANEPNKPPVVAIAVSQTTGLTVQLDGVASDPDGTVTDFAWSFSDKTTARGSSVVKTFASDGTYTATLTVTDDDGATASASRKVTVAAPVTTPPSNDAAREALPDDGSWEPFAGVNTGLMPSTVRSQLTTTGATTYSANNPTGGYKVIANMRFTGKVNLTGKRYKFKNCLFQNSDGSPLLQCTDSNAEDNILEDCEFFPATPNDKANAITGWNITLRRVWVHGTVDGLRPQGPKGQTQLNFKAYGSYVGELAYFSPTQTQTNNATHNDCIQITPGGHGILFRGCKFNGFYDPKIGQASQPATYNDNGSLKAGNKYYPAMQSTSVLMATPMTVGLGDLTFDKCWIDGGAFSLNLPDPTIDGPITITNNRFGTNQRSKGARIMVTPAAQSYVTATGNTLLDGTPANQVGNS